MRSAIARTLRMASCIALRSRLRKPPKFWRLFRDALSRSPAPARERLCVGDPPGGDAPRGTSALSCRHRHLVCLRLPAVCTRQTTVITTDYIERDVVGSEKGAQLQQRRTGRGVRLDLAERHLPDGGDGPLQIPQFSPQLGAITLLQEI
jgi:hypothetical protein